MPDDVFQLTYQDMAFRVPKPNRKDHIQSIMEKKGRFYEEEFLSFLLETHKNDGMILDCGANVGNHTLFFAGVMKRLVMAFEPQPKRHSFGHIAG